MENEFTPEDELKAENELLKLKLEMETGMLHSAGGTLPPAVENEWLNYIYNFEQMHKDAGQIKVFDFIGCPSFSKVEGLLAGEIGPELERLLDIMAQNGIAIDFLCEYSDSVKFSFITEELLAEEIDNLRIDGMVTNFIYEEFHPNHDYDLRRSSIEFIEDILNHPWEEKFCVYKLAETVLWQGKEFDAHGISEIIIAFQEGHNGFEIDQIKTIAANFSLEEGKGSVSVQLSYKVKLPEGIYNTHSGQALIQFRYNGHYWVISGFGLPGF